MAFVVTGTDMSPVKCLAMCLMVTDLVVMVLVVTALVVMDLVILLMVNGYCS